MPLHNNKNNNNIKTNSQRVIQMNNNNGRSSKKKTKGNIKLFSSKAFYWHQKHAHSQNNMTNMLTHTYNCVWLGVCVLMGQWSLNGWRNRKQHSRLSSDMYPMRIWRFVFKRRIYPNNYCRLCGEYCSLRISKLSFYTLCQFKMDMCILHLCKYISEHRDCIHPLYYAIGSTPSSVRVNSARMLPSQNIYCSLRCPSSVSAIRSDLTQHQSLSLSLSFFICMVFREEMALALCTWYVLYEW